MLSLYFRSVGAFVGFMVWKKTAWKNIPTKELN